MHLLMSMSNGQTSSLMFRRSGHVIGRKELRGWVLTALMLLVRVARSQPLLERDLNIRTMRKPRENGRER